MLFAEREDLTHWAIAPVGEVRAEMWCLIKLWHEFFIGLQSRELLLVVFANGVIWVSNLR